MNTQRPNAAIFIDYQDLHFYLRKESDYPDEVVSNLLDGLDHHLSGRERSRAVMSVAYADFEGGPHASTVQRDLYLRGIEPQFVSITGQKSTVDLQLCIDVMHTLHTRPDIDTFVLVAGGHDYLPLVKAVQKHGRRVVLVAFKVNTVSTMLQSRREDAFWDANLLLDVGTRRSSTREAVSSPTYKSEGTFNDIQQLPYDMDHVALEIIDIHFGHYKEIYLSPLLRKLSEELDENCGHEPKSLIGDLETAGAVRLEKRRGVEHDYTVLIVNYEHPDVVAIREERERRGSTPYNGGSTFEMDADYDDVWEEDEPQEETQD